MDSFRIKLKCTYSVDHNKCLDRSIYCVADVEDLKLKYEFLQKYIILLGHPKGFPTFNKVGCLELRISVRRKTSERE